MKRHHAINDDTERTVLPETEEETRLEKLAGQAAERVFRKAVIHALPAIRVEPSAGTHSYIEGQRYEIRCFEATRLSAQLIRVTDSDLLCRTLTGTYVVIPRRSVIVAYLERDR